MLRDKKKIEREAEKERCRIARESKKKESKEKKKTGNTGKKRQIKPKPPPMPEFDSDTCSEESAEPQYMDEPPEDVSFDKINKDVCYICGGFEGSENDWVGCDECPRFCHKDCTNDPVLISLNDEDDIADYPYLCPYCDYTK